MAGLNETPEPEEGTAGHASAVEICRSLFRRWRRVAAGWKARLGRFSHRWAAGVVERAADPPAEEAEQPPGPPLTREELLRRAQAGDTWAEDALLDELD